MKKILKLVLIGLSVGLLITGCGSKKASSDQNKIIIGVSPTPHRQIVELIEDDLKAQGIELEIVEFTDYNLPNKALADGDIDANFFQHGPFLNNAIENDGLDIVSIGNIHIEPIALYSNKLKNLNEISNGATIAIPDDTVNGARSLLLLESEGLIKLDQNAGLEATEKDILENPKNLIFKPLEAAVLPRVLDDVDGAVINGNYALDSGLNPLSDGILIEGGDSPYANLVAVRKGEKDEDRYKKLIENLQSDKVRDYIIEEFKGGVKPAF